MARKRRNLLRIDNATQMVQELETRQFVLIDLEVAQEYMLYHMYEMCGSINIQPTNVPGVFVAKKKSE